MKNYKIKGIELNEYEMQCIKNYYLEQSTKDTIIHNYNIEEDEASILAFEVRELMDEIEISESEAIIEILKKHNYLEGDEYYV